jgi:zinc/manganese transport system substrate-binding protein
MSKKFWIVGILVIVAIVAIGILVFNHGSIAGTSSPTGTGSASGTVLQVVAAENFWGSLVSQIGGTHVQVLSIVSDPNADPHEYESNAADARAVATANYVIENGAGYDSWMDKLLSAGGTSNGSASDGSGSGSAAASSQKVLNVANLVGVQEGGNPHLWYNPAYVNAAIAQMEQDLIALDPADASYYQAQYATLQANLAEYQGRIATIKQQYGGVEVASTESIFQYLATAAGLDLVSPPAFIDAVAEGNDPPASSIVTFENQLKSGSIRVLVYNEQTVTPLTENMKALAATDGIPVIGVTETIQPPDATFEEWMNAEIIDLQNALNAQALGQ